MPVKNTNNSNSSLNGVRNFLYDTGTFLGNMARNPIAAAVDLALSTADKAGLPTNYTNYLRDINANWSTKAAGNTARLVGAALDATLGNKNRAIQYGRAVENWWDQYNPFLIDPIMVRNNNFSEDELDALARMSRNGTHNITNADVRRVSSTGRYGRDMTPAEIWSQDPTQVVQTSIGQAQAKNGVLTDVFNVNVGNYTADSDNNMYLKMMKENLRRGKIGYSFIRGLFPFTSSISTTGTKNNYRHKIRTVLNFNK